MANCIFCRVKSGPNSFFLTCMLWSFALSSQISDDYTRNGLEPEKIYLQLSSTEFTSNQDIWFKAIVTDSRDHLPTERSGVLYVDLIDSNGEIVSHRIVKLTNGIGHGSFRIFPNFNGQFLIRAYTQWNRNFGENHMFKQDLMVYQLTNQNRLGLQAVQHEKDKLQLSGSAEPHDNIDLQFFPESGKMVHGLMSKVAFKAIGFDGKARKVNGTILDDKGKQIVAFESNSLGMGFFYLKPHSTKHYRAQLISKTNLSTKRIIKLPKVMQQGSIISIEKVPKKLRLRITSTNQNDSIAVKVSCRGVDYFLIEGKLENGKLVSEMQSKSLPDGIIVFTLINKEGKSIAERLVYNESGDELQLKLSTNQREYDRRARTKLNIQLAKSGANPSFANLSIKVINKNLWRKGLDRSIRSYFYLESELRGVIENPGHYFNKTNPSRNTDLEVLLLTQGWRNYKYPAKRQGYQFFWPEPGLMVKGKVNITSSNNKKENELDLTLTTFGKETTIYTQRTDSLGNFQFLLDDAFGQPIKTLLSANKNGKRIKNHTIIIDTFSKPKAVFKYNPFLQEGDTTASLFLEGEKRRKRTEEILDSLYGVTQLDEVIVEDYKLDSERIKFYEKYGVPDVIIRGDSLVQQQKKWTYGLYSILMANYGNEVQIERYSDGFMLAHIAGGPTLLMVDGRMIQRHEYDFVPQMPAGIIENIELIKFAKFFKSRYLTVFPETNVLQAPYVGHIISINTKGKIGLQGTVKPIHENFDATIEVFSPIKEFYSPKYDVDIPKNEQQPDLRSLIYWNPDLISDRTGMVSESFYNGDIPGDYIISVEAISDEGAIGHATMKFSVKE